MKRTFEYTWMKIAKNEIGVKEIIGEQHNSRIIEYHSTTLLKASNDEVPWCSSFVNWCMNQAGCKITKSASARSWTKYGIKTPLTYGSIVIISRGNDPRFGHVGFVTRFTSDRVWLLGGNQSNEVNIRSFKTDRIVDVVLPKDHESHKIPL